MSVHQTDRPTRVAWTPWERVWVAALILGLLTLLALGLWDLRRHEIVQDATQSTFS